MVEIGYQTLIGKPGVVVRRLFDFRFQHSGPIAIGIGIVGYGEE
jgi:hypothetical protein